ncbi:MAG TPA: hypothetical protein QGF58_01180 [Myxococcota bacterium]|nr:hypothetical protein [Myxococcota bacterium]
MRSLILFSGLMATTTGCIVYDYDEDCDPDIPCHDGSWDDLDDSGLTDDVEEEIPVELSFTPDHAEQGEVFSAVIRVTDGEMDLSSVSEITIYGDAILHSAVARPDSITAIFELSADGELGPVDIVLETAAGDGELIPGAFTVFEAGSGNSANDWNDGSAEDDCE